jgi:hypothetical protein
MDLKKKKKKTEYIHFLFSSLRWKSKFCVVPDFYRTTMCPAISCHPPTLLRISILTPLRSYMRTWHSQKSLILLRLPFSRRQARYLSLSLSLTDQGARLLLLRKEVHSNPYAAHYTPPPAVQSSSTVSSLSRALPYPSQAVLVIQLSATLRIVLAEPSPVCSLRRAISPESLSCSFPSSVSTCAPSLPLSRRYAAPSPRYLRHSCCRQLFLRLCPRSAARLHVLGVLYSISIVSILQDTEID